jgi:hypothetical protein
MELYFMSKILTSRRFLSLFLLSAIGCNCGGGGPVETVPDAPVIDESVPTLVPKCVLDGCEDKVVIFGSKQASTGITVKRDGESLGKLIPLDEDTGFSFEVTLNVGNNVFELRAFDNADNPSRRVPFQILLATPPEAPEVTSPSQDSIFVHAEEDIAWGGTKPDGTGIRMVHQVGSNVVRDEVVVAAGPGTDWSAAAVLEITEEEGNNFNEFTFSSVTAEGIPSLPIQVTVDYDSSGCQLTLKNHMFNDQNEPYQPAEYSEEACEVDGQHGRCVWTSSLGSSPGGDLRFSQYGAEGVVCEGAFVKATVDDGDPQILRDDVLEITWSHNIEQACTTCDAVDSDGQGTVKVKVWAEIEGRQTREQFIWVTADFSPPTLSDPIVTDLQDNLIEGSNTGEQSVKVCGETEAGALVIVQNTGDGERPEDATQRSDAEGAYCVAVTLVGGENNLYITSIDRAQNRSAEEDNKARLLNVDFAGPDVEWESPRTNSWVAEGDLAVRVIVIDTMNGVQTVVGGIGEGEGIEFTEIEENVYGGTVQVPADGTRFEVWIRASDNLDNETRSTVQVFKSGAAVQLTAEDNTFNTQNVRIAIGPEGHTFMVWQKCNVLSTNETCDDPDGKSRVLAARLQDDGTWTDGVVISHDDMDGNGRQDTANAQEPDVAVDVNGVAHIVWADDGSFAITGRDRDASATDILYRTWDGYGVEGLGDFAVAHGAEIGDGRGERPRVAVAASGAHVAFEVEILDSDERTQEVYYAQPGADGWAAVVVSDPQNGTGSLDETGATKPDIAVDNRGRAHVVWQDDGDLDDDGTSDRDVYFRRMDAAITRIVNGACGDPNDWLDNGWDVGAENPSIAIDPRDPNARTFVAWEAYSQDQAGVGCAPSGQAKAVMYTWTEHDPDRLETVGMFVGESIHVNTGAEFAGDHFQRWPQLAVNSEEGELETTRLTVVWASDSEFAGSGDDDDIMLRRFNRDDEGGSVVVVSESTAGEDNNTVRSWIPTVATDQGGAAHVVWQDKDSGEGGDYDLVYGVSVP